MKAPRRASLVTLLTLGLVTFTRGASARTEARTAYSRAQVFSAALRYLRVDLGQEVHEKDAEAAYLLFSYETEGPNARRSNGSIEIIALSEGSRFVVQLPQLPSYYELKLKDAIVAKLRAEYGPAPERNKPPKRSPENAPKPQ
jgi:hypothetical protein